MRIYVKSEWFCIRIQKLLRMVNIDFVAFDFHLDLAASEISNCYCKKTDVATMRKHLQISTTRLSAKFQRRNHLPDPTYFIIMGCLNSLEIDYQTTKQRGRRNYIF